MENNFVKNVKVVKKWTALGKNWVLVVNNKAYYSYKIYREDVDDLGNRFFTESFEVKQANTKNCEEEAILALIDAVVKTNFANKE